MSRRAEVLAERIEQGARELTKLAGELSDAEWRKPVMPDGRTVGVIVHHVGNMYPIEIELTRTLAAGKPITGVTWAVVADINAKHALEQASCTPKDAIELIEKNSRDAADAVRRLSDEELDRAAPVSLNADAPLTAQFFIEDHALRHSFHHLAKIRAALGR
jgi:predicted LPLAT superfamily acyltransferase